MVQQRRHEDPSGLRQAAFEAGRKHGRRRLGKKAAAFQAGCTLGKDRRTRSCAVSAAFRAGQMVKIAVRPERAGAPAPLRRDPFPFIVKFDKAMDKAAASVAESVLNYEWKVFTTGADFCKPPASDAVAEPPRHEWKTPKEQQDEALDDVIEWARRFRRRARGCGGENAFLIGLHVGRNRRRDPNGPTQYRRSGAADYAFKAGVALAGLAQ